MFAALQGSPVCNISFKYTDEEALWEYQFLCLFMLLVGFLNSWETLILKEEKLSIPVELLPLSKRIKS